MESGPRPPSRRRAGKDDSCGSSCRGGRPVVALCLGVHDLALAKLAAGRERDHDFVVELVRHRMVDREQLELGVELMPESYSARVGALLTGIFASVDRA